MNEKTQLALDYLMKCYEVRVFYPLLAQIPQSWFEDFDNIILSCAPSDFGATALLRDRTFFINLDLKKLRDLTVNQLQNSQQDDKILDHVLLFHFFGNITYNIIQAFFRYNKDAHPEYTEGKTPEHLTRTIFTSIVENMRKDYNNFKQYVV